MNRTLTEKNKFIHPGATFSHLVGYLIIMTMLGGSTSSWAGKLGPTRAHPSNDADEPDEIASGVAAALAIESYQAVQRTSIEADFREETIASEALPDRHQAADTLRLVAQQRALRLERLAVQVVEMKAAYNRWASLDMKAPQVPLDMTAAETQLRQIAANSGVMDQNAFGNALAKTIMQPASFNGRTPTLLAHTDPMSSRQPWLAGVALVADQVDVGHAGLGLSVVGAILFIYRVAQHSETTTASHGHGSGVGPEAPSC